MWHSDTIRQPMWESWTKIIDTFRSVIWKVCKNWYGQIGVGDLSTPGIPQLHCRAAVTAAVSGDTSTHCRSYRCRHVVMAAGRLMTSTPTGYHRLRCYTLNMTHRISLILSNTLTLTLSLSPTLNTNSNHNPNPNKLIIIMSLHYIMHNNSDPSRIYSHMHSDTFRSVTWKSWTKIYIRRSATWKVCKNWYVQIAYLNV